VDSTGVLHSISDLFKNLSASYPLPARCEAQEMTYIENQVPLFTAAAWRALHGGLLSQLDMRLFNTSNCTSKRARRKHQALYCCAKNDAACVTGMRKSREFWSPMPYESIRVSSCRSNPEAKATERPQSLS